MAYITLFEMATQHGEIAAHMAKYLQKQKHTYDIVREKNGLGDRIYQVFKGDRAIPIFQYRIPERTPAETALMWAHKVRRELDREWTQQTKKPELTIPTSPAPAPDPSPVSGVGGTPPDSPSLASRPTSSSTPTSSDPSLSNSSAVAGVPGASALSPLPTTSSTSSETTTKASKKASRK